MGSHVGIPGRGPLNLRRTRVSAVYRDRLVSALLALCLWCVEPHCPDSLDMFDNPKLLDKILEKYIQFLYNSGRRIAEATHAVLAVQHANFNLKGQLKPAWGDIRSWKMGARFRLRVPMPKIIYLALFCWALLQGMVVAPLRAHEWVPFAIGVAIGFEAMLRPIEISRLSRALVLVPADGSLVPDRAVLTVMDPKTRCSWAVNIWLTWTTSRLCAGWAGFATAYLPSAASSPCSVALQNYLQKHS